MASKPISAPKSDIKRHIEVFERALSRASDEAGRVDMPKLRAEVRKTRGAEVREVLDRSLDVLEARFGRTASVGCGTVRKAPASLSTKQVKSVFAALIEAKSKGLDKIDADKNGRITSDEADDAGGRKLSDKLTEAAVDGTLDTREDRRRASTRPAPTRSRASSSPGRASAGCGGSSGSSGC
ncbi:MAG: hypothetical protein HYV07_23225 [Deltaproteobacteria bacterium]|nr:hypothetical protein [Deltaproteobacteria bacterium]